MMWYNALNIVQHLRTGLLKKDIPCRQSVQRRAISLSEVGFQHIVGRAVHLHLAMIEPQNAIAVFHQ